LNEKGRKVLSGGEERASESEMVSLVERLEARILALEERVAVLEEERATSLEMEDGRQDFEEIVDEDEQDAIDEEIQRLQDAGEDPTALNCWETNDCEDLGSSATESETRKPRKKRRGDLGKLCAIQQGVCLPPPPSCGETQHPKEKRLERIRENKGILAPPVMGEKKPLKAPPPPLPAGRISRNPFASSKPNKLKAPQVLKRPPSSTIMSPPPRLGNMRMHR